MNVMASCVEAVGLVPLVQTTTLAADFGGKPVPAANAVSAALPPTSSPAPGRSLHRLGEVRQRERLTRGKVAKLLGISIREVEQQEQSSSDMLLSDLYRWRKALGVPVAELLNEPDGELSPPVQLRARLVRVMKTVRSIQERARQASVRRLAEMLVEQLVEVMPELKDTVAWPAVGQRRRTQDFGQAFFRGFSLRSLDEADRPEGYP
jgi:transcriptional regulator with XRE-family HTH domain